MMIKIIKYKEKKYTVDFVLSPEIKISVNGDLCEDVGKIRKNTYYAVFANDPSEKAIIIFYLSKLFVFNLPIGEEARVYAEKISFLKMNRLERQLLLFIYILPISLVLTLLKKNGQEYLFPILTLLTSLVGIYCSGFFKKFPYESNKAKRILIYLVNVVFAIIASFIGFIGMGIINF